MVGDQEVGLGAGLHPFGHHPQPQVARHVEDGLHQRSAARVVRRIRHEAAVDLQLVQRHAPQVGQAGIAGAEIVDGKAQPQRGQLVHPLDGGVHLVDQQPFRHLQDQQAGRGAGGRQRGAHLVNEGALAELAGTDIDRQRQPVAGLRQAQHGQAGLFQGPLAQLQDQARLLRHGDEHGRRHVAAAGQRPAHQHFRPHGAAVVVHLGLGVHGQPAGRQRGRQVALQVQPALHLGLHGGLVEGDAVAAAGLGAVHGGVGLAQQVLRVLAALRQQRDADAGRAAVALAADLERGADGVPDLVGHRLRRQGGRLQRRRQLRQHDDKFVAADARHGVGLAHQRLQAFGHGPQQHVAGAVAAGVVDELEAVQVDEHDGAVAGRARAGGQQLVDAVDQQAPVGQARQHVIEGQPVEVVVDGRQVVAALLERGGAGVEFLERARQVAQQHGARQGEDGGDEQEVEGDDERAQQAVGGQARHLQRGVGPVAQGQHGGRGQGQQAQGGPEAQQQRCQHGDGQQVDLADGPHLEQQAHAHHVDHAQEMPHPHRVGQPSQAPDGAGPGQGGQVEHGDRPDPFARSQQRAGHGRDHAQHEDDQQQPRKDLRAPVREGGGRSHGIGLLGRAYRQFNFATDGTRNRRSCHDDKAGSRPPSWPAQQGVSRRR